MLLSLTLFLLYLDPILSFLPTFSPQNKEICGGFGHNWAAEIRCLRDVVNKCSESSLPERKGRSLASSNAPEEVTSRQQSLSKEYGSPYYYPRPYSRTYYRHSVSPIRSEPTTASTCNCDNERFEKLEAKFEKKLYEVKMRAAYDTETGINDLRKKLDNDIKEFQRITTVDVVDIRRQLDYFQAPRIVNGDTEYFLIKREESWYTASEKCLGYGAHLTSVHSRLENGLVTSLIPENQTAWIGVNDIQKENVFRNADSSDVDFFKWGQKQPNNEEHNENCVEVDHAGRWNDKLCIVTRPFVCKKRIER
uniref:C-type lectin domain-containing protein n=1 Tax=Caenorhabditis japonica TaxID=281687 RepID=A0A8R1DRF8_CAEJA